MTPDQCRVARAGLNISMETIAKKSGLHKNTIQNFESGKPFSLRTRRALKKAFESMGIVFLKDDDNYTCGVVIK